MSSSRFQSLFFLVLYFVTVTSGKQILSTENYVALHPPANVTIVYIGNNDVFFYWFPPSNYEIHRPMNLSTALIHQIHQTIKDNYGDSGKLITHLLNKLSVGSPLVKTFESVSSTTTTVSTVNVTEQKSNDTASNADLNTNDTGSSDAGNNGTSSNGDTTTKPPDSKSTTSSNLGYKVITENDTANRGPINQSNNVTHESWYGKPSVPMSAARIESYIISWKVKGSTERSITEVPKERKDFHLKNLKEDTAYELTVSVRYKSQSVLSAEPLSFTTKGSSTQTTECLCNKIGTVAGDMNCDVRHLYDLTRICECKKGYAGLFCHVCDFGYYRMGPDMPCYRCPCSSLTSNTACHFEEGYLFCDACVTGYSGNLCHECHQGYFMNRTTKTCKRCNCHNNSYDCVQSSGECFNCKHNTAGFSCERCRHDYIGDAIKAKNCTHKSQAQPQQTLATGWIATISVAILLIVFGILGFFLYRRYRYYPSNRPFWTVELKDDHEGVNFSSVPEDELHGRDDIDFYEKQGGKRGRDGSQQYSHLTEST